MVRLARSDVNTLNYIGFPIHKQICEVKFEAAVYKLLCSEPKVLASRLLYHRIPKQRAGLKREPPQDITGRRLFLFEKAEGEENVWCDLSPEQKVCAWPSYFLCSVSYMYGY